MYLFGWIEKSFNSEWIENLENYNLYVETANNTDEP